MTPVHLRAYYDAALTGLRYLEHRSPSGRRFGEDADLRWSAYRGHLQDIDRLDLLIRDADAQWPGSMGARRVFARHGVAEDDAFGAGWDPLDPVAGADLWREARATPPAENLGAALTRIAAAWKLALDPFAHEPPSPSARLVLAGPSAIVALAESFEGRDDLDWADQVVVVAARPAARQLAAFCGAALNVTKRAPALLAPDEPAPELSLRGYSALVSPDASPDATRWVAALTET